MRFLCKKIYILLFLFLCRGAYAGNILIDDLGVSFFVSDGWSYQVVEIKERGSFAIPLTKKNDNTVKCRIDRNRLPFGYHKKTQEYINKYKKENPMNIRDFKSLVSEEGQVAIGISASGQIDFKGVIGDWYEYKTHLSMGNDDLYLKEKIVFTQTPEFAWTIQCVSFSDKNQIEADARYNEVLGVFNGFFNSIKFYVNQAGN